MTVSGYWVVTIFAVLWLVGMAALLNLPLRSEYASARIALTILVVLLGAVTLHVTIVMIGAS